MDNVKLIECINTWQGEGPDVGQRMLLCRFKYCNLRCPWCDTLVKMRAQQEAEYNIEQLQEIIDEEKVGLMITGGEPTFNSGSHRQFTSTVNMLNNLQYPLANVETNGFALAELVSAVQSEKPVHYIYSPKLFNEKDLQGAISKIQILIESIDYSNVYLKPVCEPTVQMTEFLKFLQHIKFPNNRVYLMIQGSCREELLTNSPTVFDMAEEYKFNISGRSHLIYDFV